MEEERGGWRGRMKSERHGAVGNIEDEGTRRRGSRQTGGQEGEEEVKMRARGK